MHYLIISSEFPPGPGGIGKHAYCMAKALVNNGITVTVVCNMDYASEEEISKFINDLPKGLTVQHIKRDGINTYLNRIKTVLKLYKSKRFDKIIVTGQFPIWLGGLLKTLYKNKVNVASFIHGSELLIGGSLKRYLTKAGLQRADKIYAVSNYTAQLTREIISKNIEILPNGLDISEWQNDVLIPSFNWRTSPNLLTVGSITPRKGQHNVIAALPALLIKYPNMHYHIVGMSVYKDAVVQQAQKQNVINNITIHGKLNDKQLKAAYKASDIFIMLSERDANGDVEGFGIAVLEANALGIPAIGSKNSGIEDAIQDGYNGYLVDPKDIGAIASAVDKILAADKNTLSNNCVSWAQKHDWNKLAKSLL